MYIYIYIHIYIYIFIYICIYICIFIYIYIIYTYAYLNMHLYICIHIYQSHTYFSVNVYNAGGRTDLIRGSLSPNLQARICKLYPADFVGWNWVIQVESWFPKNGEQGSLHLYIMPGGFFQIDPSVKSPRAWRCWKRAKPSLEKFQRECLNWTKHKQILKARNTQTSKLQAKNRQDRVCRIELADLGLNFPRAKSVLLPAQWCICIYV